MQYTWQRLERSLVQVHHQDGNGTVECGQAEEALLAQPRQNPAFDHLHAQLHFGLVAGFDWSRRHDWKTAIRREFFEQTVRSGLVAVRQGIKVRG